MVTIAEKDVLLEYSGGAIALTKGYPITDPEVEKDVEEMGELYCQILDTKYEDLDYDKYIEKIKRIRAKYERE